MALTSDQLSDLQGDLGITADATVFTDAELNRLFDRADSDYNTAVYLGWRQLLSDATKFFNFTAGQTRAEKAVIFDHIEKMVTFWKDESRTAASQVAVTGITPIPPRWKDRPNLPLSQDRRWRNRITAGGVGLMDENR